MPDAPSSSPEVVLETPADYVALVTLNRPQARNAINTSMAEQIEAMVARIETTPSYRVAILASSLDTVFCAGADLAEIGRPGAKISTAEGGFAGFVDAKRTKPWIAAVRGAALGGGFELCLACDMIIAAENSRFGLPEVKRGLFAGAGGVHRTPRALPRHIALELVTTGDDLSAARAYALGLVNRLAEPDAVLTEAINLASRIAANAPLSVRESLALARAAHDFPDADLRQMSKAAARRVLTSADAKEGPRAFKEKRAPNWTGE